ncbi:MAG: TIGR02996 domain-containing protein, partial [Planctomycetes bacterium]|nr:TIGR02996 domain-containing protein [Planctomycetota bacterium]
MMEASVWDRWDRGPAVMTDLAALEAAIIDAPTDRTVRLVYADALDESGAPGAAARAEFVRAQIEIEALPETDFRRASLVGRCDELFAEHWDDWWRPVCTAVGLPEPYVPRRRRKPGGARRGSRLRRGAPYER